MGQLVNILLQLPIIQPIVKLLTRLFVGMIAIPIFRLLLGRFIDVDRIDYELHKDLSQWFRGSLLLLVATANLEHSLFGWIPINLQGEGGWITFAMRLLLALGVVEAMPDQALFAIIHPGPPRLNLSRENGYLLPLWTNRRKILKGLMCQHINRSSPVFAILSAVYTGWVGWTCYGLALAQYLLIGLVTSRDKLRDVLAEFDSQTELQRRELIEDLAAAAASLEAGTSLDDEHPGKTS